MVLNTCNPVRSLGIEALVAGLQLDIGRCRLNVQLTEICRQLHSFSRHYPEIMIKILMQREKCSGSHLYCGAGYYILELKLSHDPYSLLSVSLSAFVTGGSGRFTFCLLHNGLCSPLQLISTDTTH